MSATLVSLNVGLPKDVAWQGHTVHTGIWKYPVQGPRMARTLNIDGDGQGDLAGHGGEMRAVLAYQTDSYRYWASHLGRSDLEFGQFGENFTVDGLSDDQVCIGDRYRIGEAEFEVTQPRVTCFRLGMRMGEPELPSLLVAHHRPGFYLRVITEGRIQAGDAIVRTRVGRHALSVADIDALLYLPDRDLDKLRAAVDIPALSPGWQQSFRELLVSAQKGTAAPAPPVGVEPEWQGFRRLRVSQVVRESPAVVSVYLTDEKGEVLPEPQPGQFLTLRAAGAGDPAPVRSYSLSARPDEKTYRISVKREPQGVVSGYVHSQLQPGSILEVAAPHGDFVLADDDGGPLLLVSAGIGVTPVLAMLHRLAAEKSSRSVWWIHVTRDASLHAFAAEAQQLLDALPAAHECIFYTAPQTPPAAGSHILHGRPTFAALSTLGLPVDAAAYICGPQSFMSELSETLVKLGLAQDRLHTELFGALPPINPGITDIHHVVPHQPPGPPRSGPQITFARGGLTVRWADSDGSLLDLADACDVPTRWSCRAGVCHTCVTPILSGRINYAPSPLEKPGSSEVLICCAQPAGDLVLDL